MRILVFRMGFAGDVLFSTAALEAIKRKYPHSELTYGVWKQYHGLLETNPHIDKFVHNDGIEDKVIGYDKMGCPVTKKVISRDGLEYAKKRADKAWEISHEKHKMAPGEMFYWGEVHARQAAKLGLLDVETMTSFKPQIYLSVIDMIPKPTGARLAVLGTFSKNGADARLWGMYKAGEDHRLLGLQPGSFAFDGRYWPRLVKTLNRMGFQCVQLGGEKDPRLKGVHDLCGRLSWRQSVGVVMQADVCVTIDSFLLHAAVARKYALDGSVLSEGTPTVALLGPTDGRGMFPADAEQVAEVCARRHGRCPCYDSFRAGRGPCEYDNDCLKNITAEQVVEAVERIA